MKWVGITGGIGTGKSTVAHIVRTLGYPVIDADQISRDLIEKEGRAFKFVVEEFGEKILTSTGQIDRKKLGQIVFKNPEMRKKLESIIHPLVQQEVLLQKNRYEKQGIKSAFYDVPLLFENYLEKNFDAVILVYATKDIQVNRLKSIRGMSEIEILDRIAAQLPLDEKRKRSTFIIENVGTKYELEAKVSELLKNKFFKN